MNKKRTGPHIMSHYDAPISDLKFNYYINTRITFPWHISC